MSDQCALCIQNNLLKSKILAEDEHCYFAELQHPVLTVGGMIIPKRHIATPFDLNDDEWESTKILLKLARTMLQKRGVDGFNIGWNVGEAAGQTIMDHAHLHVIGRFKDEPLAGRGVRYFYMQENNKRPAGNSQN